MGSSSLNGKESENAIRKRLGEVNKEIENWAALSRSERDTTLRALKAHAQALSWILDSMPSRSAVVKRCNRVKEAIERISMIAPPQTMNTALPIASSYREALEWAMQKGVLWPEK